MDPIDAALQQIDQSLSSCAARLKTCINAGRRARDRAVDLQATYAREGMPLWRGVQIIANVLQTGIEFTFDAQLSLSGRFVARRIADRPLQPISWQSGDYLISAIPTSSAQMLFITQTPRLRPLFCAISSDWSVTINGASPVQLRLVAEVYIDLHTAWPQTKMVASRGLIFLDASGEETDPLQGLPTKGRVREQARTQINDEFKKQLSNSELPSLDTNAFPFPLDAAPLCAWCNQALMIFLKLKDIPQRRAAYAPAISLPYLSFDAAFRIKSDIVVRKIEDIVKKIPASVVNPRYAGGAFRFTVAAFRKENQCIAEARVWLYLDYVVSVITEARTRLTFLANQTRWWARWEVDWCFHKCDEAEHEIRQNIAAQVAAHRTERVSFGDLSGIAKRAVGSMDNFGLIISWEAK